MPGKSSKKVAFTSQNKMAYSTVLGRKEKRKKKKSTKHGGSSTVIELTQFPVRTARPRS